MMWRAFAAFTQCASDAFGKFVLSSATTTPTRVRPSQMAT